MANLPAGDLFRQISESIPQLIWLTRPDGYHEYYNQPWYDYTGLTPEQSVGPGWRLAFHPDDLEEAGRRWAEALRTGEPYEVEYRCRRHDGVWRWFLGRARPVRDESGHIVRWFGTCTDIDDQRRAADAMRLLDEASSLLSSSQLDYEATLVALTRLAVPSLADWCTIEIAEADGTTRQVGVAHVDPAKVRWAEELRLRYPPKPEDEYGVLAVIRAGQPRLVPEITDEMLESGTYDAEHLRIARELGLRSALVLPLTARGRTLGALMLVSAESGRRYSAADMPLAEQLASRAALAVDNARLFRDAQEALRRSEKERRVAETLMRIGGSLASELDATKLVQRITDETVALTGAAFGAFFENLVDERGESYMLYTLSGAPREAFAKFPMPRATAVFGPTFRGEGTVLLDDVKKHPHYGKSAPYHGMPPGHLPVCSYLAVSVVSRSGAILGGLFFGHPEPGRFTAEHARLVEGVASQAAVALDNARLFQDARRMEQRFRSLVTASAQAVWVTQPNGDVVEDSPSWRAFTGQTYEEWRGHGWLDAVHPEDREMAARVWRDAVAQRTHYEVEYRLRRPDGSYSPTRVRGVPVFNADGSVREWVGTNTDITVQRRAEESARRLDREKAARRLEALRAEVSQALSREGTVPDILQACAEALARHLSANAARLWLHVRGADLLELAGNAGPSALPRDRWARLTFEQGLPGAVARTREQVWVDDLEEDARLLDLAWVRETGCRAFSGIPLLVRDELVGVLGVYNRQSLNEDAVAALAAVADAIAQGVERRRAEEALKQHAQELARSNEELQQFAYVASHDLQEPLRMVASYTQLLGRRYRGKLDADADEFIHYAVDGVTRMQRLIQDLLAYSRVGTRGREPKPVDAVRALERAKANLQASIQETGATVLSGALPQVFADETQLAQVFQNLIGNALKFHGAAPPHVEVSGEQRGTEVRFAVKDRGIGIDPQYFDRIFIIFQRLHAKEEYPGTGIGLAICKKIIERHGGRIGVESQQGQGTTFWFTLPAAPSTPGA
ncbi:PAS domain-containing protein [Pyxidicoccus fallax]|uniref:GAF domain-containing protein n=1 Tax=Pyxidicoccus fallax TaxID=394095 RepID=UPI0014950666|nr:GAF domain-containing protein [Pyxidicoccus fallax]NPC82694.1 PAS domain-containing protein [Pyxidicoccus fallax]